MFTRIAAVFLLVSGALMACTSAEPAPQPSQQASTFPVTITHAFGVTTIDKKPERVVVLGWNDLAIANALNTEIVAAVRYLDPANPNPPYVKAQLSDEVLALDPDTISPEKIAGHGPDLILATSAATLDQAGYDQLGKIAPTVAFPKSLHAATMEEDATLIGRAVGDEAGAQKLVSDVRSRIDQLKKDLPKLEGKSYFLAKGTESADSRFLSSLGLKQAAQPDSADLLFAGEADKAAFDSLEAAKDGRFLALTPSVAQLLQAPNVVGVEWLLEQLRPTLRKVGR